MKIGLIDAELMWTPKKNGRRYGNSKADIFPNIPLMKLSGAFKEYGEQVEWYDPTVHYDRVYISRVFTSTPIDREIINADHVYYGGSGWNIMLEDGKEKWVHLEKLTPPLKLFPQGEYMPQLDYITEHHMPDYGIYPMIKDTALGFLTRKCPRRCSFCHVAEKEGTITTKVADLSEWWDGQKNIVLCDPNILACKDWKDLLSQLADSKAKVDINQGLDARLLTEEKMEYLNRINLSTIHFAWDSMKDEKEVLQGLHLFASMYSKKLAKSHAAQVFVLTNYDTTIEEDLYRIYTLRDMGFEPYVMVYDKSNAAPVYKSLQRWVNMRAIFHTVARFEDYDRSLAKE